MIMRFKNAIKGESGMPTTEAVALIAIALLMFAIFTLFKDNISRFLTKIYNTVNNWSLT